MTEPAKIVDHLFRQQYGKMVSVLTRIFGLTHLETVEDAVQDTFSRAIEAWSSEMPENPEAWLMQAAKNRTIDLFRSLKASRQREAGLSGPAAIAVDNFFLDSEIEDSQLRMIFAACHPSLDARDQLAFSLKTISGFSIHEIAAALLLKEETVKKRLARARQKIKAQDIGFGIPQGQALPPRLDKVHQVLYLIFNEGFHSANKDQITREELCGEAIRLCRMLSKNRFTQTSGTYALFALMCFQSARLPAKVSDQGELVDLRDQDRSKWYWPLMKVGNAAMNKAVESGTMGIYHYEAAIACEHLKARSFESTNWNQILEWYERLLQLVDSPIIRLNMAMINFQLGKLSEMRSLMKEVTPGSLEQRAYLYYGTYAEYYSAIGETDKAAANLRSALELVTNQAEKTYLTEKLDKLIN